MAGVPGVNGQRVQKPVAQERSTVDGNAKVTAEIVPVQMKRPATVTRRNVQVKLDVYLLKKQTSKTPNNVSVFPRLRQRNCSSITFIPTSEGHRIPLVLIVLFSCFSTFFISSCSR